MYKWVHRITKISPWVFTTSGIRHMNKPQYITQFTPKLLQQYQIRVAQQWLRQHVNWQSFTSHHRFQITVAATTLNVLSCHGRNTLNIIYNRKVSLYAHFPVSRFAPHTHLSQIYSHETSRLFILTSTLFVSILTPTKAGECLIS